MTGPQDSLGEFARVFGHGNYHKTNNATVIVDQCHTIQAAFRNHPEIERLLKAGVGLNEGYMMHYLNFPTLGEPCVMNIEFLRSALDLFESLGWESIMIRLLKGRAPKSSMDREIGDVPLEIAPWMPRKNYWDDEPANPQELRLLIAPMRPGYNDEYWHEYSAFRTNDLPEWVQDANGKLPHLASWFERMDK